MGVNIRIDEQTDARFVVGVINSYSQFVECEAGETCYIHINDDEWSDNQGVYVAALVDDNREGGSGKIKVSTESGDSNYDGIEREVSLTEYDKVGAAITFPDGPPGYISEGGQGSFSVGLGAVPYNDVTVAVAASGDDSFSVSPTSLTFTSTNFSSKQWVSVRAADDADGLAGRATITLTATSTDSGYRGLTRSFSVREVENDTARFVLSSYQNPLTITEGGDHTYSVRLDTEPTANVTVGVGVNGGDGDISVSPASLTFTPINYGTNQSVTVNTKEDDDDYVSETATITHSVSGAAEYRSLGIGNISVTSRDDDSYVFIDTDPNASGEQTGLALAEGGGSATYKVWLSNEPTGNVTVDITETQNPTTGNVRVTSSKRLTFTASNWDTKQTVRVRAYGDSDAINGIATIDHAASGGGFDGVSNSVSVVERDSRAAIVIDADATRSGNQTSASVNEGGGASYTVALAAKPSSDVTVTATVSGDDSFSVSSSSLTFTPDNYDSPQTVTLTALPDPDLDNGSATIAHDARGGGYDGVSTRNLSAREIDKTGRVLVRNAADTEAITRLGVPEGGSATYKVKLNVKPKGTVTVRLRLQSTSGADAGDRDITASPTTLYFSRNNWDQAKTVTVRAAQDADYMVGSRTIDHTATGGGFNVTDAVTLTASEMDDEASFLFTDGDGNLITGLMAPEGGSADYYVALSTPPTATVEVDLSAGGDGDITVSPSLVIFTATNWDVAQKVTASAAEDDNRTNDEADISHVATSSDPVYSGKTGVLAATEIESDPGVVIRNADDDAYVTELDVREGSSATYSVKLSTAPWLGDTVTVTITGKTTAPGNDPDLTVDTDTSTAGNQTTLSFDATNWNTTRTVTVRAANDNSVRKCKPERVFTHTADGSLSGGRFSTPGGVTLTATELDNDSRHVVLCNASGNFPLGSLIVPEGAGAAYSVRLNRAPSANVTVNIRAASSGDTDITSSVASLSFTTANWNVAQSASLWAAEDDDLVSGSRTINHTASGHSSASLLAVEQDNDAEPTDSISAYDSTATTVLLQSVEGNPARTYSYRGYSDYPRGFLGCVAAGAESIEVYGPLSPGTEYTFGLFNAVRCPGNPRVLSNTITTKPVTLASSNITGNGATLSVSGWTPTKDGLVRDGPWRYKADIGPHAAACSAGQTGDSINLTGLDSGTAYTYVMYQDKDCANAVETFPTFTTPGQAMTVATHNTTATLTLPGYTDTSTWYHKHDGDGASCEGPVSAGAAGSVSGLTRNTEYLFKAYSNSNCTAEIAHKRARTRNLSLAASNLRPTTATLTLSGWAAGTGAGKDGNWWHKSTTTGQTACAPNDTTGLATTTVNLSGLTKNTQYTYTAYSDSGCTVAIVAAPAFTTPVSSPGDKLAAKNFTVASPVDETWGIWSNGTTIWVTDYQESAKLYAYKYSDRTRDSAKDIPISSPVSDIISITGNGSTIWVAPAAGNKLYAYNHTTKTRDSAKDITLHSSNDGSERVIWTDGDTMWVGDDGDKKLYAYAVSNGARQQDLEFDLHSDGQDPGGLWSDGITMWVSDWVDTDVVYAYRLSDGTRVQAKEYTTNDYDDSYPGGMWSDGTTLWMTDYTTTVKAFAAFPPELALFVTNIGTTTATLELLNHSGAWWYKSATAGQTTCTSGRQRHQHSQPGRADRRGQLHLHRLQRRRLRQRHCRRAGLHHLFHCRRRPRPRQGHHPGRDQLRLGHLVQRDDRLGGGCQRQPGAGLHPGHRSTGHVKGIHHRHGSGRPRLRRRDHVGRLRPP